MKALKKRQKIILVLLPLPLPSLLLLPLLAIPAEPTSADESEDENIKKPIKVEDKDIGLPSLPPPTRFTSI